MTMKSTNIPLTDTPAEGGGPTAQVAVESAGTSQGYAAAPDPGPIVIAGPGLAAGVLGGGVPGIVPPTKVPTPPGYPFSVSSDAASTPEAKFGSGPVQMRASSAPGTSQASASVGLQAPGAANAGLATSVAEITPSAGLVLAKAVSRAEGLTVGPLTIGSVTSVATETLDGSGKLTPSTQLQVNGMAVNGQSFGLGPQGFGGGGSTIPVPLNPTLESALKASGISVKVVAAQTYPNRVVAPALEVTMPFDSRSIPGVGQYKGTMTLTMGFASAAVTPAGGFTNPAADPSSSAAGAGSAPAVGVGSGAAPPAADTAGGGDISAVRAVPASSQMVPSAGTGEETTTWPSVAADENVGQLTPPARPVATAPSSTASSPLEAATGRLMTGSLASASGSSRLDVRGIYLIGVLAAITALAGGEAVRRLGARHEG
jgi:hypothetical protein